MWQIPAELSFSLESVVINLSNAIGEDDFSVKFYHNGQVLLSSRVPANSSGLISLPFVGDVNQITLMWRGDGQKTIGLEGGRLQSPDGDIEITLQTMYNEHSVEITPL